MTPLFEVVVNQNAGFLMDWGADPGARNHQVEREVRSFLKAAGRSKNEKIRELVLGKAREEQGSEKPKKKRR